jgi:hypothetical protein
MPKPSVVAAAPATLPGAAAEGTPWDVLEALELLSQWTAPNANKRQNEEEEEEEEEEEDSQVQDKNLGGDIDFADEIESNSDADSADQLYDAHAAAHAAAVVAALTARASAPTAVPAEVTVASPAAGGMTIIAGALVPATAEGKRKMAPIAPLPAAPVAAPVAVDATRGADSAQQLGKLVRTVYDSGVEVDEEEDWEDADTEEGGISPADIADPIEGGQMEPLDMEDEELPAADDMDSMEELFVEEDQGQ